MKTLVKRGHAIILLIVSLTFLISIVNADMDSLSEKDKEDIIMLQKLHILAVGSSIDAVDYTQVSVNRFASANYFILLNKVSSEAQNFDNDSNFKDVNYEKYSMNRNILSYMKNHSEIGFSGYNDYFRPESILTVQELCKVLLVNLGYKQDIDFQYKDALKFAEKIGLKRLSGFKENDPIMYTELWLCIVDSLRTPVKDSRKTLIESLADKGLYLTEEVQMVLGQSKR